MEYSRKTLHFVYGLIDQYKKFDKMEDQWEIDLDMIPDIDQEELAWHIYSDNMDLAYDATGADNEDYYKLMHPTLMKYLKNSVDKENQIDFVTAWREGMVNHAKKSMSYILQDLLVEYNEDWKHGLNQ